MNREAGKGDDRRPEAAPGLYAQGHDAIDWTRTERQQDQQFVEQQRAEYLAAANRPAVAPEWGGMKL